MTAPCSFRLLAAECQLPCHLPKLQAVRQLLAASPETAEMEAVSGLAPVHLVCFNGHVQVLELLLSLAPRAVSVRCSKLGWTALHTCCMSGQAACARLLCRTLPGMARVRDVSGLTPLAEAASSEAEELVALLLQVAPETLREQDNEG